MRRDAEDAEPRLGLRPDPPQATDGKRREERGFFPGRDGQQAVGLAVVGGDLRDHLPRGHACTYRQARRIKDLAAKSHSAFASSFERGFSHSQKGFIEREAFDRLAAPVQDAEYLARYGSVFLHVGSHDHQVGTRQSRFVERHRGADSEWTRLVGRGEHDCTPAAAGNRHRLTAQPRIVAHGDARIECIDVDVDDELID